MLESVCWYKEAGLHNYGVLGSHGPGLASIFASINKHNHTTCSKKTQNHTTLHMLSLSVISNKYTKQITELTKRFKPLKNS